MRKHFLILMLLTLLPLAGWAQVSIEGVDVTIGSDSYYYTNSTPVISMVVNSPSTGDEIDASNYMLVYFDADNNPINKSAVKSVGTYYVAAQANGESYEGVTKHVQFNIVQMPLVLIGTPGSKTYGDTGDETIFTFGEGSSIKTKYNSPSAIVDLTSTLKTKISFSRATPSKQDQGEYTINAEITDATYAGNYTIASADIKSTADGNPQAKYGINKKAFTASGETPTIEIKVKSTHTYNGEEQEAVIEVKDKALNKVLTAGTAAGTTGDYYVTYSNNTNAGNATATITGKNNYQATANEKTFKINTATLIVTPYAKKEYNGEKTLPTIPTNASAKEGKVIGTATAKFTFQGFVDGKDATAITVCETNVGDGTVAPAWTWVDDEDETANVGTNYAIKFSTDVNKGFKLANYTFYASEGTYDITQKTVGVVVDADQELSYGEAENFTYSLTDATYVADDEDAIKNAIVIEKQAPEDEDAEYDYDLVPRFMTDAEIDAKTYSADAATDAAAKAAAKQAVKNYKMDATNGDLTVKKAELKIALKESKYTLEKVYDGTDVTIAKPTLSDLTIIGLKGTDQINIDDLTVTVTPKNNNIKNVNTYQIVLDGAKNDNYNISYIPSTYTVTARPIMLSIPTQNFVKGKVPTIAQNYKVETILDGDEPLAEQGIAPADAANVSKIFKLTFDPAKVEVDGETGVITTGVNLRGIADAIVASNPGGATSLWANYEISYKDNKKGTAVILANTAILLTNTTDLSTLNNTNDVSVTFGSRKLTARVWTAMVLPFKATVREISTALGYAVVDKFVADNTSADMNFKIYMGEIPAYTPFLVKTDEDVDLNTVVFDEVDIVKLTDANKGNLTQSNMSYDFIGTSKSEILTGTFWAISTDMTETNFEFTKYENSSATDTKYTYPSMRAIIRSKDGSNNAPRIFIEEPDGSTTAINAINADGEVVKAEGWYNLNGVKLQGMPTQKGIYINNGKKIVIK